MFLNYIEIEMEIKGRVIFTIRLQNIALFLFCLLQISACLKYKDKEGLE